MADNPITTPLPADLPTDWVYGQTIGPQGTDVGLTQQHGYNYLMQQVNAAQQAATQIGEAFSGLPSLGSDGKIPASQLPAMNYDPAGSAAAVQANLDAHTGNKSNPHGVTASQVGAVPIGFYGDDIDNLVTAGFYRVQAGQNLPAGIDYGNIIVARTPAADTVLQIAVSYGNQFMYFRGGVAKSPSNEWQSWSKVSIDGHTHDASQIVSGILPVSRGGTGVPTIAQLAQSLFPTSIGSLPDTSYNFAITGPQWNGNGYMSFQALMSQITANGGCRIATGSYAGVSTEQDSSSGPAKVFNLPFVPKALIIVERLDEERTSDINSGPTIWIAINGATYVAPTYSGGNQRGCAEFVWSGATVSVSGYGWKYPNWNGSTYDWFALG